MDLLRVYDLNYNELAILNDNSPTKARDIKYSFKINDIPTLTFTMPIDSLKAIYVTNENLISWKGEFYFIKTPQITHSESQKNLTVTCKHLSEGLKTKLNPKMELIGKSPNELIQAILGETPTHESITGWRLGRIVAPEGYNIARSLVVTSEKSAYTNLKKISELFNSQLKFNSQNKTVDLLVNPVDRSIYVRKGNNLKSIDISYDTSELVTKLYAFGGTDVVSGEEVNLFNAFKRDSNGEIVYTDEIDDEGKKIPEKYAKSYIEDYSYYLGKGFNMDYIKQHPELFLHEQTWKSSEYLISDDLYIDAKKKLDKLCKPIVKSKIKGVDLSSFPEYFIKTPILGEIIHIIDEDIKINMIVKVIGITKNSDNPLDMEIEVTNKIEYNNILNELIGISDIIKKNENHISNITNVTQDVVHITQLIEDNDIDKVLNGITMGENDFTMKYTDNTSIYWTIQKDEAGNIKSINNTKTGNTITIS